MNDVQIFLENSRKSEQEEFQYCSFLVKFYSAFYDEGQVKVSFNIFD